MNTNTFALHSSPVGPKRFGGMDSCRSMPRRTLPPKRKMASAAANCKFHERPLLYLSTRLIAIVQRAFQKGEQSVANTGGKHTRSAHLLYIAGKLIY